MNAVLSDILPKRSKIAYGFAQGAHMLLSGLGLGQIMYFYTAKFGLNAELQGIAWLIFAFWNAINDPLLGILEDRTKSRLGRRIPYLRYGAFVYIGLFIWIWFPFATFGDQSVLFVNLLLMLFLFDTIYSMIGLITFSLPAEMAISAKERGSIMIYATIIGFIAQAAGYLLPILFLKTDRSLAIWQMIMVGVGVLCGIILYLSSYFIKENKWAQREPTLGFIESIRETFKNRQFLILEISLFMLVITQTILTGGILFLINDVFIIIGYTSYLYLIPVILTLLCAIFFFNRLIGKVGIKKVFIGGSLIGSLGFGLLPFCGRSLSLQFIPLMLIMVFLAALIMGEQLLMAEVIDYDEVLTGKRRETTYSGINALLTKPAISIANWLFLLIISAYGYIEGSSIQPPSVVTGILLGYSIIPVSSIIISAIALSFFKLEGPEWLGKKKGLQQLHIEKEQAYIEELKQKGLY
jgi:GPH family glycoside/pentoside/hexuronide:cation symporter